MAQIGTQQGSHQYSMLAAADYNEGSGQAVACEVRWWSRATRQAILQMYCTCTSLSHCNNGLPLTPEVNGNHLTWDGRTC